MSLPVGTPVQYFSAPDARPRPAVILAYRTDDGVPDILAHVGVVFNGAYRSDWMEFYHLPKDANPDPNNGFWREIPDSID